MFDIQRASLLKRASAYLLDIILIAVLVTGFAWIFNMIFGYDNHIDVLEDKAVIYQTAAEQQIEDELGLKQKVDFKAIEKAGEEEFKKLPQEVQDIITEQHENYRKDEEVIKAYNMMNSLMLLIGSLSLLLSFLIMEFIVPLVFKNGQTIGKKVFSIGVIHPNCVKISNPVLFVRGMLGKYTIETMVPVVILLMVMSNLMNNIIGIAVLITMLVLQIAFIASTKTHTAMHDMISDTVVVDMGSQYIFESVDKMLEAKTRLHAEQVEKSPY